MGNQVEVPMARGTGHGAQQLGLHASLGQRGQLRGDLDDGEVPVLFSEWVPRTLDGEQESPLPDGQQDEPEQQRSEAESMQDGEEQWQRWLCGAEDPERHGKQQQHTEVGSTLACEQHHQEKVSAQQQQHGGRGGDVEQLQCGTEAEMHSPGAHREQHDRQHTAGAAGAQPAAAPSEENAGPPPLQPHAPPAVQPTTHARSPAEQPPSPAATSPPPPPPASLAATSPPPPPPAAAAAAAATTAGFARSPRSTAEEPACDHERPGSPPTHPSPAPASPPPAASLPEGAGSPSSLEPSPCPPQHPHSAYQPDDVLGSQGKELRGAPGAQHETAERPLSAEAMDVDPSGRAGIGGAGHGGGGGVEGGGSGGGSPEGDEEAEGAVKEGAQCSHGNEAVPANGPAVPLEQQQQLHEARAAYKVRCKRARLETQAAINAAKLRLSEELQSAKHEYDHTRAVILQQPLTPAPPLQNAHAPQAAQPLPSSPTPAAMDAPAALETGTTAGAAVGGARDGLPFKRAHPEGRAGTGGGAGSQGAQQESKRQRMQPGAPSAQAAGSAAAAAASPAAGTPPPPPSPFSSAATQHTAAASTPQHAQHAHHAHHVSLPPQWAEWAASGQLPPVHVLLSIAAQQPPHPTTFRSQSTPATNATHTAPRSLSVPPSTHSTHTALHPPHSSSITPAATLNHSSSLHPSTAAPHAHTTPRAHASTQTQARHLRNSRMPTLQSCPPPSATTSQGLPEPNAAASGQQGQLGAQDEGVECLKGVKRAHSGQPFPVGHALDQPRTKRARGRPRGASSIARSTPGRAASSPLSASLPHPQPPPTTSRAAAACLPSQRARCSARPAATAAAHCLQLRHHCCLRARAVVCSSHRAASVASKAVVLVDVVVVVVVVVVRR